MDRIFPNFRGENKKSLSCHHLDDNPDWEVSPLTGVIPFQMAELHGL